MSFTKSESPPPVERGNYVSEWFGHRVYPVVAGTHRSLQDQKTTRCPFLTAAMVTETCCVKPALSNGICTISSCSNGPRQDWLVCPYRVQDTSLMTAVARRLFGISKRQRLVMVPAPRLSVMKERKTLREAVIGGGVAVVYFQGKLGGEISLSATERSPELAFDTTMVEIRRQHAGLGVGKYGILEVQTMDFHGSYRYVVTNLKDALRLHGARFHRVLRKNQNWLGERIEGPNIANVFKRTFYQIMLKFQIGTHESSAGCVLAIPSSVWDSWQRHLGKPALRDRKDGTYQLSQTERVLASDRIPAWIYVFDIEASSTESPNPIQMRKIIATEPESLSHYALKVVPDFAIAAGGSADRLRATVIRRLAAFWPEILRT